MEEYKTEEHRTYWRAFNLVIEDEPLIVSLFKYRLHQDRSRSDALSANLVSSKTADGKHKPVIDIDFPAELKESATPGHYHLYLNKRMNKFQWFCLMVGLRMSGVIEEGFFVWSLRRGQNFVRLDGAKKSTAEQRKPRYGWFFRLRK